MAPCCPLGLAPRWMNCHGVAGLPCRSTHRFAPQAQSSMSSRHGEAPGHSRFSEASCWWPPPVPFVCMADFFARSGGLVSPGRRAGKARVFRRARVTGPSSSVMQRWCAGCSWLLSLGSGSGCKRTSRRRFVRHGSIPCVYLWSFPFCISRPAGAADTWIGECPMRQAQRRLWHTGLIFPVYVPWQCPGSPRRCRSVTMPPRAGVPKGGHVPFL